MAKSVFNSRVYRISPYTTYSSRKKSEHEGFPISAEYEEVFTESGRQAIDTYLKYLQLSHNDIVTILTTSGSSYISSCVTSTIEKYCVWNRNICEETKCILVIHEFGKIYTGVEHLKVYDVPIVEDFAHSFFAINDLNMIKGDAAIFSLSKFLPVEKGGILLTKNDTQSRTQVTYKNIFAFYREELYKYFIRKKNVEVLYDRYFEKIGLFPFFKYKSNEVPGAYIVSVDRDIDQLQALKEYLQYNFIEASVFYGNKAIFLPCNHNMEENDVDYIVGLISRFLNESE